MFRVLYHHDYPFQNAMQGLVLNVDAQRAKHHMFLLSRSICTTDRQEHECFTKRREGWDANLKSIALAMLIMSEEMQFRKPSLQAVQASLKTVAFPICIHSVYCSAEKARTAQSI